MFLLLLYRHVCGRWPKEHPSADSDASWFSERADRVTWRVRELLRQNLTESEAPWAVVQAKKLYESCIDIRKFYIKILYTYTPSQN